MNPPPESAASGGLPAAEPNRWSRKHKILMLILGSLLVWGAVSYILMPDLWSRYMRRHPSLHDIPGITHTGAGIDADPLNAALIGTKAEVMRIMVAAKWYPADPLTLHSCLEIAEASVLKRPYDEAPVSNLFLFGRKQDLAFEKPVGNDPRQRHHVRFWLTPTADFDGRPIWIGAAVYDRKVGLSRTTGQITHHTGVDVDTERDYLFNDLEKTGQLASVYTEAGFHKIRSGRNGEGDPWRTDGDLRGGVIQSGMPAR